MLSLRKIKITDVVGDANNPRDLSGRQSEMLRLSLRKFGLMSPLFITDKGLLLSGHQRTKILRSLNQEEIYVSVINLAKIDVSFINSLNFIFNKELQEISNVELDNEEQLMAKYDEIEAYLNTLPDMDNLMKPLESVELIPVEDLKLIKEPSEATFKNSALLFNKTKVTIPLIIDDQNQIVNGSSRFQVYAKKFAKIPCIRVKGITPDVFHFITANYSLKGKEDNIRVEQRRHLLSWQDNKQFLRLLTGSKLPKMSKLMMYEYISKHFKSILDFGSGNGKQSVVYRQLNKDPYAYTLFEPFAPSGNGDFSFKYTYESISNFLDRLEDKRPFDLVKVNAVLNSIPFEEDSRKVELLIKFLCTGSKALILSSRSVARYYREIKHGNATTIKGGNKAYVSSSHKTKVQRFHSVQDLDAIFGVDGNESTCLDGSTYIFIRIIKPKYRISKAELMQAVEFEFGLKYYNRTFEDLKKRAMTLFSDRYDYFVEQGLLENID